MFQIRTDLALETREKFDEDHIEVKGVRVDEERISPEIMITRVFIDTENGAKAMKKPKGTYITIEASDMMEEDEDYHREVSGQLAKAAGEKRRTQDIGSGSWQPGSDTGCIRTLCSR